MLESGVQTIRTMGETDLGAVCLVEQQIYEFPWTQRNFQDSIRAGYDAHCLWMGYSLVAYVVVMKVVDESHLLNLSVRADLQGQGYGKQLLNWSLERAQAQGMQGMLLEVRPSNLAARALYDQSGFQFIGLRKNYYPAHEGREDAMVLFKRFDCAKV